MDFKPMVDAFRDRKGFVVSISGKGPKLCTTLKAPPTYDHVLITRLNENWGDFSVEV